MRRLIQPPIHFTFHNVSINTRTYDRFISKFFTLHSTMFLLIRSTEIEIYNRTETLHSTMFLLIHSMAWSTRWKIIFTFHNVSINTKWYAFQTARQSIFTFHNVSINTVWWWTDRRKTRTLHSTMFLLILHSTNISGIKTIFTFHNVSINTQLITG